MSMLICRTNDRFFMPIYLILCLFLLVQVIWVCIVCRKKQELLIKTGQWLHSGMAAKHREMEDADDLSPKADKRPKLERAHSEGKENTLGLSRRESLQQIHRTNSQRELRRQYSQERDSLKQDNPRYSDRQDRSPPGEVKRPRPTDGPPRDTFTRLHGHSSLDGRYEGCSDPSYDKRKDRYPPPDVDHRRHQEVPWKEGPKPSLHGTDRRRDQPWMSSQDDDRRIGGSESSVRRISQESLRDHGDRPHRMPYSGGEDWKDRKRDYEIHSSGDDPRLRIPPVRTGGNHLEPGYISSEGRGRGHNNRKKVESVVRNDSLSSDQSESMRPPPPKPHKNKRGRKLRQRSLSSSDDEIRSTPECSSCEEIDAESESISEKGE